MDFDDIKLAALDNRRHEWIKLASKSGAGICQLANRYRQRDDCMLRSMHCGSFNFSFRLNWDDQDEDWLIRFPLPGKSMFLDEKVRGEAFVMKYIARETTIPVPRVITYGTSDENPTGLGPFIMMTWIDGKKMSDILRQDDLSDKHDVLDPAIDPETLKILYGEMAEVLLQLWGLDFSKIGSISEDNLGKTIVDGRPLTRELNELMRTSGLKDCTPQRTFHTSIDYIASLLELQSTHLEQQRNSVYDSQDCREKYACRQLMKAIALNFIPEDGCGPFKLFCDDLCPGNVLVDDSLRIVGVLDWEFTYAAPSQFAASIPSWLLLRRPHSLVNEDGPDAFLESFLPKANIFLEALEERERTQGLIESEDRLSGRMRRSLEDRSAWFTLALHMGASVDLIYWDLLDEYCWGPRSSIAHRVHDVTTSPEMHMRREEFVHEKIRQLWEYHKELGRNDEVEYEPELPLEPAIESGHAPQSPQANSIANRGFLEGALAGLTVGLGFTICVKWYRS
ncbi:phosphotransferase family protein [Aspergillus fijiensis CBS 313.89]|uniref:Aminoglycoside phosphotransferase domain-containing protein n=1 Tax=Aspergillus fijiensis CBS 313.89 TaxID=1448319 RepID=A0A8G1VZS9_9EURO|nr:uncharacterized protein BO72DRAFT_477224 [Aspergillus fijiensis CBS 313.89]RAK77626.1 hypothetical protein BO72DRAFT_477224 [Aspergillus fijiensis CBS 313.89]